MPTPLRLELIGQRMLLNGDRGRQGKQISAVRRTPYLVMTLQGYLPGLCDALDHVT